MQETKGIIFDLYNTLLYSSVRKKPYLELFRTIGLTKDEMQIWRDRVMTENFETFGDLVTAINSDSKIYAQKFDYEVQEENQHTHVFDDTYFVLEQLSKNYKLFLLSNIATPYKECVKNLNLDKYFTKIYFSCDIGYRKPQPEAFNLIIKESGLKPSQLLMIGDSLENDFNGAQNCGIQAILKNRPLIEILPEILTKE